jgi:hypothetical protein
VHGVSLEKPVLGTRAAYAGVRGDGLVGVVGYTKDANAIAGSLYIGVLGCAANDNDPQLVPSGRGVLGLGTGVGVEGRSITGTGVYGYASRGWGVGGESIQSTGVSGYSATGLGVDGYSQASDPTKFAAGVRGHSPRAPGVYGSSNGWGVYGECTGLNGTGVIGWAHARDSTGVVGVGFPRAALFVGDVLVTGNLMKPGGGFTIDHPLDPEGRYLNHSFVESPERKNLYDGIVSCDQRGEATVELPAWFEPLNEELRYQLTPIGGPAPELHVASEVEQRRFRIAGGTPGLKVSWQVTGVRSDPWAKSNPLAVEEEKAQDDRGSFLHPEAHGHEADRGIHRAYHEQAEVNRQREQEHNAALQARIDSARPKE